MMQIQASFYVGSQEDFDVVQKGLAAIAKSLPEKTVMPATVGSVQAAETPVEKPAKAAKAPKKAAPVEEAGEAEAEAPVKAEKAAKGKKAAAEESAITIKEVRKVFSRLLDTLGDDEGPAAGKKLLKKYNAKDIPSIDPEHYQAVVDDAESLIREAENTASGDDEETDDFGIGSDDDDE